MQFVVRDETAATLLVANGLALAAFVAVWGAVRAWVGEAMARRATLALALFPTSYFLWMYYTEALFITATAAAVWAGRRDRHTLAAVFLAVASTTRLVGVTVGPALALARIVRLRRVDSVSVRYVLGSLVGLGAVMARQAVEAGDPLGWLQAGRAWDRELDGPWTALYRGAGLIVARLPDLAGFVILDVVAVVAMGCLVLLLWRGSPAWRLAARGGDRRQPALARAHLQSAHLQPGALHDGVLAGAARPRRRLAAVAPRRPAPGTDRAGRHDGRGAPLSVAGRVHRLTAAAVTGLPERGSSCAAGASRRRYSGRLWTSE